MCLTVSVAALKCVQSSRAPGAAGAPPTPTARSSSCGTIGSCRRRQSVTSSAVDWGAPCPLHHCVLSAGRLPPCAAASASALPEGPRCRPAPGVLAAGSLPRLPCNCSSPFGMRRPARIRATHTKTESTSRCDSGLCPELTLALELGCRRAHAARSAADGGLISPGMAL